MSEELPIKVDMKTAVEDVAPHISRIFWTGWWSGFGWGAFLVAIGAFLAGRLWK